MFLRATNKYGTYSVPQQSQRRPCSQAILKGQVWEQATIDCIIANTTDGNIVHCGAFFGDMLPALSQGTANTIHAFEPADVNYQAAVQTVKQNNCENIVLKNVALSNVKGNVGFVDMHGGTSYVDQRQRTCVVQAVRLDEEVDCKIDVIHLDVERHELQALQGAFGTICKYLPTLIIETPVKDQWWHNIEDLGYVYSGRCDVNYIWQVKKPGQR